MKKSHLQRLKLKYRWIWTRWTIWHQEVFDSLCKIGTFYVWAMWWIDGPGGGGDGSGAMHVFSQVIALLCV